MLFLKAEASACQPLFTYPSTFHRMSRSPPHGETPGLLLSAHSPAVCTHTRPVLLKKIFIIVCLKVNVRYDIPVTSTRFITPRIQTTDASAQFRIVSHVTAKPFPKSVSRPRLHFSRRIIEGVTRFPQIINHPRTTEDPSPLPNLDSSVRSDTIAPSGVNVSLDMRRSKILPTPTDTLCQYEFPPEFRCPGMPTDN